MIALSAMTPLKCGPCICFFDVASNNNIFNCSSTNMKKLPEVPELTTTIILTGSSVTKIDDQSLQEIQRIPTVHSLKFTNTKIRSISRKIQNLPQIDEIWLAENPFVCDCSMTWMIPWLNRLTKSNKTNIVRDFKELRCGSGRYKGILIYVLTEVAMGCYPRIMTTGQIVGVCSGIGLIVIIFSIILVAMWRSREVKFFLFHYLNWNTKPKDDRKEILDGILYDAYFCYWFVSFSVSL